MNDINWLHAIHYYCDRLLELWPGKVALGTALAAVLTALGIDHVLFGVLLASVMGEMLTRIIVHCKRGKSLCRGLHHGLVRYSCYFFFLLMAVGVDISLRRALGFALPVTDVFMAYLVLTDCASIIGHLVWLGVPVPPLLVVLVTGSRTRLEKTVEDAVEDGRPRPGRLRASLPRRTAPGRSFYGYAPRPPQGAASLSATSFLRPRPGRCPDAPYRWRRRPYGLRRR